MNIKNNSFFLLDNYKNLNVFMKGVGFLRLHSTELFKVHFLCVPEMTLHLETHNRLS